MRSSGRESPSAMRPRARPGQDLPGIDAGPVVGDLDEDPASGVVGVEVQYAGLRFTGGPALFRRLDPMVQRVADQMDQRIADLLHHGLVELGVLTRHPELDVLAELVAEISHQARKSIEREADRHHPDAEHAFLQLACVACELCQTVAQPAANGVISPL